ncbi:MAG: tRNA (guanosine(46)-N7)-methyltransferase TrmB [Bacilli bacterium]|jgi:tRNA (guanine-N7-)-methyltransferase
MRTRFKPWAKPYLDEHRDIALEDISGDKHFFTDPHLRLEIGCGKGDFVIALAERNPSVHFLAIEVAAMVAAMAARKIVDKELKNVRLLIDDAAKLIPLFPDQMFEAIYLNFSDPWPKKRHEKRRLTSPAKLLEYMRILKVGGHIYFKSDNDELYEYSLSAFKESPFEIVSHTNDYQVLDCEDAMTEYEKQFRGEGKTINRLVARRNK